LTGILGPKSDSDASKRLATVPTSSAANLGNFAPGALVYAYLSLDAKSLDRLMGMNLRMLSGGKPTPGMDKALAEFHNLGRIETLGSFTFGGGIQALTDSTVADPKKYIAANQAMLEAMKGGDAQQSIYKELKVEPEAKTYEGMTFTHITATLDMDNLAKLAGNNPAQAEAMKSMFGGESLSYWYGTDGKRVLQVTTPKWEDAKAQIDSYLKGSGGIGSTASYKAVRSQLPDQDSVLVLVSAQGLCQMFATQFAAMTKNPNLKVPEGLPKEPALLGFSLTPRASAGYEFHLVVPSDVGSVIEKGLVPLFQGLAGAANPNP
jgi:hypothetical protein